MIWFTKAWTAQLTAGALRLLGANGRAHGSLVKSSLFSAHIILECTAAYVITIYLAAVVAYPCRWRSKMLGVVLGVPSLVLANQMRLLGLFYVGYRRPDLFETAHLVVSQSLMVFATVVIWLVWVTQWVYRHEHAPG